MSSRAVPEEDATEIVYYHEQAAMQMSAVHGRYARSARSRPSIGPAMTLNALPDAPLVTSLDLLSLMKIDLRPTNVGGLAFGASAAVSCRVRGASGPDV
jgi:hypothetical protein